MINRRCFIKSVLLTGTASAAGFMAGIPTMSKASNLLEPGQNLLCPDYTARDYEVVDYKFYQMGDIPNILFRGTPVTQDQYFSCLGAAQTLGVYVERPFPAILSEHFNLPVWNAGIGGATANFFLNQESIIAHANKGQFVVLQVMTARSEPNSRFSSTDRVEFLKDNHNGDVVKSGVAWDRAMKEGPEKFKQYLRESQESCVNHYRELLEKITVPTILFWFSSKVPGDTVSTDRGMGGAVMDTYPQFIEWAHIEQVSGYADRLVACHSSRNTSHLLTSRFTGKVVETDYAKLGDFGMPLKETHNLYYPSPEMHIDAAEALKEPIAEMIAR